MRDDNTEGEKVLDYFTFVEFFWEEVCAFQFGLDGQS